MAPTASNCRFGRRLGLDGLLRLGPVSLIALCLASSAAFAQAEPTNAPLDLSAAANAGEAPPAPAHTASIAPAERQWRTSGGGAGEADMGQVKRALEAAKAGRVAQATQMRDQMRDPVAKALVEWAILRSNESLGFSRLNAFITTHPGFPGAARIRQRAEGALLEENVTAAQVRAFYANRTPTSAKGKLALALAKRQTGDQDRAMRLAREIWRTDDLSADVEARLLSAFGAQITRADHKARMDRQLHEGNERTALRAAGRLGQDHMALARAVLSIGEQGGNGAALLGAVPSSLHGDPMYLFARAQLLRRADRTQDAARILLGVSREAAQSAKPEEWWIERRVMVRKLLDEGDARTAYRIAAGHPVKAGPARVEAEFHAGWVALRHLNDAAAGLMHFEQARAAAGTPMSQSRAYYWIGRAHAQAGQQGAARQAYERAARNSSHYYGQLARAKLGMNDLPVRRPAEAAEAASPAARAVRMLYAAGERDLARVLLADMGQRFEDQGHLAGAAEAAARAGDAKGVVTLGKLANNRGLPFDVHAFPTIGIPAFQPVGADVDKAVVYAIARQESTFDARARSHAGALGLLQLMPATARQTARAHGLAFDLGRLTDPAYNARLGSAHLGELLAEYRGSYILTFAAYNAGRGRVREWIEKYGDPRNPSVDPVDWVERIPFTETRNYVQRVMENVQVYRARLGGGASLRIEADMRRGRAQ